MKISDRLQVKASLQHVWITIFDIPFVASCMPGVEDVQKIDDRTYQAIIRQEIMHMSADFDTNINICEIHEHESFRIHGTGKNKLLGGLIVNFQAMINPISQEITEIRYDCDLNATGRLASFGQKAIALKVNHLKDSFGRSFKEGCEKLNMS